MARHRPADDLLIYCVAGAGEVTYGGQSQPVTAGELLLFPAGLAHRYQANPQQPWTHLLGTFGGA